MPRRRSTKPQPLQPRQQSQIEAASIEASSSPYRRPKHHLHATAVATARHQISRNARIGRALRTRGERLPIAGGLFPTILPTVVVGPFVVDPGPPAWFAKPTARGDKSAKASHARGL